MCERREKERMKDEDGERLGREETAVRGPSRTPGGCEEKGDTEKVARRCVVGFVETDFSVWT